MQTTDKVQTGDPTTGTSTSTTYTYSNHPYNAEKGWECPRCGRINAPWVRQCDCPRNNWTITTSDWTYTPEWQKEITCTSDTSDTFKIHPDSTVYTTNVNPVAGGSDYKDSVTGTWVNVPKTYTNSVKR